MVAKTKTPTTKLSKSPEKAPRKAATGVLTPKQEAFARAVAGGKTQSDAYRAAFNTKRMQDNSIHVIASRTMANTKIRSRVEELRAVVTDKAMMTAADVLKEAMRLARFDIRKLTNANGEPLPIHDLDDDTAAAIQGLDFATERGQGENAPTVIRKYKVADKNAALEKLFKHFGLYNLDNAQKISPLVELMREFGGRSALPVVRKKHG